MPSNNKPIISIKDLTVTRNGSAVLHGIHADIHEGEVVAIIGPNGAGKSTLLKCLLGLLPYTGSIEILGNAPRAALSDIGYVPQGFSFDTNIPLTVSEFLGLGEADERAITEALGEVEMGIHAEKRLGALSGGQLQRVLIARAILGEPKLLLLDEPTANVDMEGEKDFYEIIRHQNKVHGATVIMISHEMNMVYNYATQVICLNKSLVCMGVPDVAITKDVMAKLYGNEMAAKPHRHK